MQEPFDNIQRLWALKTIIESATAKYQGICKNADSDSQKSISQLMNIVSDAANKISHMRWTDNDALYYGVMVYTNAINNL